MTRLSFDVSNELLDELRMAAKSAGYKSTAEFARQVLASVVNRPTPAKAWGGARNVKNINLSNQVAQVGQIGEVHLELTYLGDGKPILQGSGELVYEDMDE